MSLQPPPTTLLASLAFLLSSWAIFAQTPAADPKPKSPQVKEIGPQQFEVGGIRFNGQTREIRVPTVVNIKQAPIEYMLVHETGKVHEAVLRTQVKPSDLQIAMLLCHFEPGTVGLAHPAAPKDLTPIKPLELKTPGANRVILRVEWTEKGSVKQAPLADWMQDINTRKPPPDLDHWIFSGSYVDEDGFAADREGSFIASYLDRNAMFNSPAKRNWDDAAWISNPTQIPEEGTAVTLIITPVPSEAARPTKP